jgi:hypothetical protein
MCTLFLIINAILFGLGCAFFGYIIGYGIGQAIVWVLMRLYSGWQKKG